MQGNGGTDNWKVPSWSIQTGAVGHRAEVNAALAAPLPLSRPGGGYGNSRPPAPPPADSDGVPSVDGDAGELSFWPWSLCGPRGAAC